MPDGGHISCEYCAFNRLTPGRCDIFGVQTSPYVLCRSFRAPGQSHTKARERWDIIKTLEPGIVYAIDNSGISAGNPRPLYTVVKVYGDDFP